MVFRYAWIWLLVMCVTGVAGLILGVTLDLRWLSCGLMVVAIVMPVMLAFLYYYFGLRREAYVNTLPHTLSVGEAGLTLTLRLNRDEDEEEAVRDEFFAYADMRPMQFGAKSAIIPFKSPAKGFIWIPADAYVNPDTLVDVLKLIDTRIHDANGIPMPTLNPNVK